MLGDESLDRQRRPSANIFHEIVGPFKHSARMVDRNLT